MTFTRHLGKISENRPHRPHPRLIGAFQPIFPMDQCAENFLNQLLGSMGPSSAHGLQKAPVCFWRMTCVIYGFRGKKSEFISHMLHGAGIFTYKTGWFLGQMLVNIPAPWSIWDGILPSFSEKLTSGPGLLPYFGHNGWYMGLSFHKWGDLLTYNW